MGRGTRRSYQSLRIPIRDRTKMVELLARFPTRGEGRLDPGSDPISMSEVEVAVCQGDEAGGCPSSPAFAALLAAARVEMVGRSGCSSSLSGLT